jgi:hypothetical protein
MARTSDKHAPRLDDQLEHEEQALTHGAPDEGRTEPRRSEAPGPGEGGVGARPEAEDPAHGVPPVSEVEHVPGSPTTRSSSPWSGCPTASTRRSATYGTRCRGNDRRR